MARRAGLWWRVTAGAGAALTVTAVALAIALTAEAHARAASRELDQRLIPAAAAAGKLLQDYTVQTTVLRNYLTGAQPDQLAAYRAAGREIPAVERRLGRLLRGYRWLPGR